MPVFLTLVFGAFDYGLMFFTQFQASAVVHTALREGALVAPSEYERAYGGCDECQAQTGERASSALDSLGIDVAANDLKPDLVQLAGACALVLRAEIPYTPLIGLFSVPDHYIVSSSLPAPMVPLCE
ncbi:MAG: pilus assembly protein [Proteobacteria bacterium]|nr:pilus assembly protein [Pseudomonadota bacterium]